MEPASIGRLREYLQKRRIRPRFTFTQGSDGLWICQASCGPYSGMGGGNSRNQAKLQGARSLVKNMRYIRNTYRALENDESASGTRENRENIVRVLNMLARRIQDSQNEWTEGHSILFEEELGEFLRSQQIDLEERVNWRESEMVVFWTLNTSPKITRASRGPLRGLLRYELTLRVIESYLEYLNKKESQ